METFIKSCTCTSWKLELLDNAQKSVGHTSVALVAAGLFTSSYQS
jgi:hypothetical protein